ncbi:MAG: hypothetical protein ACOYXT_08820 [Bacteroidota bacterium]
MKIKLNSYWLWYFVALTALSLVDFAEHITRTDTYFFERKWSWLLFCLASGWSLILAIATVNYGLTKLFKRQHLILESASIVAGMFVHIYITGPLNNELFFSDSQLNFFFNATALAIGLTLFYVIRLIIFSITRFSSRTTGH